ncbi:NAD(P)H-binding protein [Nocardioides sp. YIM 152588]|uniref:SDR family oxidoreductase n=1 Tax=Nocardioides sp. YIM 152588 TaxID=3158259 RepID=UPI0032E3A554
MVSLAVAGGTGLVGRMVVAEAGRRGHDVRVLARSTGVDLTTGEGLDEALAGVERVVDVTNLTTLRAKPAVAFFEAATTHLVGAAERAGVGHVVALSVVGCDRVDLGYYVGKRAQEAALAAGPLPWTVLRSTQFHEFANLAIDHPVAGTVVTQQMRCRPIAAAEVAARLLDVAEGAAAGRLPDLGGPEEQRMDHLVRRVMEARGIKRRVVAIPMLGRMGKQVAAGGLLPTDPSGDLLGGGAGAPSYGTETFDAWLTRTYPRTGA